MQILVSGGMRDIDGLTLNVTVSEDWSFDNVEASLNGVVQKKSDGVVNLICNSGNQSFYSLQY